MKNPETNSNFDWTILKILNWTTDYFKDNHVESPRASAEILLAHALDFKRIDLYLKYDQPLTDSELAQFKTLIKRRIKHEPVAYITGVKEFWSFDFHVTEDVLIPRPETECLVEKVLARMDQNLNADPMHILELGTGSGAVILTLALEKPDHIYFATDYSLKALQVAQKNTIHHKINDLIRYFCSDWLDSLNPSSGFDVIITNPPYIPSLEISKLQPEIHQYEPKIALSGDKDGLGSLQKIILQAYLFLKPLGSLIMEIGHDQKNDVLTLGEKCGRYMNIQFSKDYSGVDRIVQMQRNH